MRDLGYARDYDELAPSIGRLFDLTGRLALVTGGANGIGRAIALGLARFGADLAVVDVESGPAEAVAEQVRGLGRRAEAFAADVTDLAAVEALVERVERALGPIEIGVNSAGGGLRKSIFDTSPAEWHTILDLNLTGTWNVARAVGAGLVARRRGKLINLASMFGHVVDEGQSAYASAKGGVVQLTKVLAVEWAPHNVQVNCLAPSHVRTRRTQVIVDNPPLYQRLMARSPLGRFGEPWELIGPAVFLASDASGLVTGHSILVDGGWTAL